MTMRFFLLTLVISTYSVLSAKEIAVGPQFSAFIDTEASTNVAFNVRRSDVKVFDVRIELASSVSNCVQVAFGRDADADGDLSPEETDLVLGWRSGRYFVEDVADERRVFEASADRTDASRFLQMTVTTDDEFVPRAAAFTNEVGACFSEIGVSECLFKTSWDLAKVTRRGATAAGEWCRISSSYRYFFIRLR